MAKYLIVGGVAGGASTAARLRRLDEESEIIMFEKGEHISYANCGLPYYIGGIITDREQLLVQTPESFHARFNIDVRIKSEVIAINTDKQEVQVSNIVTGKTYIEAYDKLVLSPGAAPLRPGIKGIDHPSIFTLRNVADTDKIKDFITQNETKRAVVIGAGFVGVEMAENLHHQGAEVTIVEAAPQILTPLDFEMAAGIHQHLKMKHIGLLLNDPVQEFEDKDGSVLISMKSGRKLEADIVILSIGVRPDAKLAKEAGIAIGEKGGILVDKYLQTSIENIYAVGDAIEFENPITKEVGLSLLAGPANKQGRILADNLVKGHKKTWKGSIGTAIAKVMDYTIAATGANERTLKRLNIPHLSTIISSGSHAGYYPGAMPMTIKITFSPEGKLYGAQIIGTDGVDKRADIAASILGMGGSIYDLQEVEHAYAPPFSSAKDPLNQIGFNAENILNGFFTQLSCEDVRDRDRSNTFLLDVRVTDEYALGTIDDAVNIPVDELRSRVSEVPKDKKIYIICSAGLRAYVASRILHLNGYDTYNLGGGISIYRACMAKQENTENIQKMKKNKVLSNISVNACGLQCPGPIIKLKEEIDKIADGERLSIEATDAGFYNDVESWCNVTANKLIAKEQKDGKIIATIEKRDHDAGNNNQVIDNGDNKTIIVFSDDMDKALASFVIANGAAAMGKKVTMFFTFWGLNVVKAVEKPKVKKDFMGYMFGKMMPSNANKLTLSNMNMAGLGSKMMKMRMRQKNVDMLDTMINHALESNVEMIACQMSMDIMGVNKEEFIDGVTIGGVANYLEAAEKSNVNLFI